MDGSGSTPPRLDYGLAFSDFGSYGLRQYSGWIREEFLPQLVGREAARVYREMLDNSSTVGAMIFAIIQSMRRVEWKVVAPGDDADKHTPACDFVESCMEDMSHTWEEFIAEALSMLGYGYSVNELVYKRRMGTPEARPFDLDTMKFARPLDTDAPPSKHEDGLIGWRRLPIRGQDTIIKWMLDINGQVTGVTQQPWVGQLIDIPETKFLLFRPTTHKNNPEGRSVLRNAYRSYWFVKRLEELEAIMYERLGGFPVLYVPNSLLESAQSANSPAAAALASYKNIITNIRINEQMGALLPSDVWQDADGKPTAHRMFELQFLTPQHGSRGVTANESIERHKLDMMMTTLCDFIKLGHEVRGTNNLAVTRVDLFYQAIEGWLTSIATVMNRVALPRLWRINALPEDTMPEMKPELPTRIDLDGLGGFMANLAKAGMPLFPDEELQEYIRGAAGLPEVTSPEAMQALEDKSEPDDDDKSGSSSSSSDGAAKSARTLRKMLLAAFAQKVIEMRRGL